MEQKQLAGIGPVERGVRPRAWWVAPEDRPSDGAVWTCEPTAKDLAWLKEQTGMDAVVTELGDVAAERDRCMSGEATRVHKLYTDYFDAMGEAALWRMRAESLGWKA